LTTERAASPLTPTMRGKSWKVSSRLSRLKYFTNSCIFVLVTTQDLRKKKYFLYGAAPPLIPLLIIQYIHFMTPLLSCTLCPAKQVFSSLSYVIFSFFPSTLHCIIVSVFVNTYMGYVCPLCLPLCVAFWCHSSGFFLKSKRDDSSVKNGY